MKKKLQIFVSSTYRDLMVERQAAVEAILRAGHIPAGMELFAAGDKSQLETIYRWIDESDVYLLILGGRYGSVEGSSGKSYTQLEYEYAISTGTRFFAIALTDGAIDNKLKAEGRNALETEHPKELAEFRRVVMSKICRLVDDCKDIKLAIHETILEFLREYSFDGWVSGKNVKATEDLTQEIARLTRENTELRQQLKALHPARKKAEDADEDFASILALLGNEFLTYEQDGESYHFSASEWFYDYSEELVSGILNSYNMSQLHNFLFFRLGPVLSIHGLLEDQKVAGSRWGMLKTTKKGNALLVYMKKLSHSKGEPPSGQPPLADLNRSEAQGEAKKSKAKKK